MDRVEEAFDNYMNASTWYQETYGRGQPRPTATARTAPPDFSIAYFSAEFGIHESVPVYSRRPRRAEPATISRAPAISACRSSASA